MLPLVSTLLSPDPPVSSIAALLMLSISGEAIKQRCVVIVVAPFYIQPNLHEFSIFRKQAAGGLQEVCQEVGALCIGSSLLVFRVNQRTCICRKGGTPNLD